ncbi:MAG: ribosome biogenesis GTPase Der [Alphaproteobacteria bacterium 64-6]|nr:ribosome biogenesis GTPase Der [Hyphomicrobium sp.]MBN9268051.1 ribosome biogenesis GTPase Der [Hyphomicrobium sp.]OJU25472.1 MAG: ribosome biogenesis GTPase Der [Alphaproteobacteria bacterium 64-6]
MPTIAIVGRPNVGKSTLFNRLTGRRTALVSDMPGLTRDRREGEADIGGHILEVVDTAGLEEADKGSIADRMRSQSELAIRDADAVAFVFDARAGVTPTDKAFARIVRASGRPVVLVANKCEGKAGTEGFYEAYALGLGEPVAISAEHGEGLAELESELLAALGLKPIVKARRRRRSEEPEPEAEIPEEAETEAEDPGKPVRVAIVGRPNAGKSTLVNAILGEERMITGPEPGLTRDSISSDLSWQGRAIKLFDTAGLRRKARIDELAEKLAASDAVRAIRFAEVVVLLIDAERPFEQQDLTIGNMIIEEGRALVIAVNKWDLVEDKQATLKDLKETVAEKFAEASGVSVVTISAASGRNIDKLMKAILDAHAVWSRRISTAEINRWLQVALARHAPPQSKGRRIRIRYMTQPSARPPTFIAFCSQPGGIPESYMRYLTNSLREAFDMPGTPIRINLRKGANPYADK